MFLDLASGQLDYSFSFKVEEKRRSHRQTWELTSSSSGSEAVVSFNPLNFRELMS
jgi:hypothetical protein